MKRFTIFLLGCLFSFGTMVSAQDLDAIQVIQKTRSTYRNLKSFRATAKVEFESNISKQKTTGHLLLARPNMYKVDWRQANDPPLDSGGVAWNTGNEPFFYLYGSNYYTKFANDEMNLTSSGGVSLGISGLIPSIFYSFADTDILSRLTDQKLLAEENIQGQDCYTFEAKYTAGPTYTIWIAKKSGLILKTQAKFHPKADSSKMEYTDDQIRDSLKKMGQEVTEQNIANMKKLMAFSKEMLEKSPIQEATVTTNYIDIQTDSEFLPENFKYSLPKGAVYKPSTELFKFDVDQIKSLQNSLKRMTDQNQKGTK